MKNTKYIATISGGKDSTVMCDLLLKNNYQVDYKEKPYKTNIGLMVKELVKIWSKCLLKQIDKVVYLTFLMNH